MYISDISGIAKKKLVMIKKKVELSFLNAFSEL